MGVDAKERKEKRVEKEKKIFDELRPNAVIYSACYEV